MFEPTIKDIAQICGVGVSTVSRAINNHPDINPETKQKVMDTIREHGYIPNNSARNLKRIDAKSIAVLVKGMTNPVFSSMIKVIEAEIKRKKYAMVLNHVNQNEDEVDVALEVVKEKRVRGIIFLGGYFNHDEEKLEKLQVPFILSTVGAAPENVDNMQCSSLTVDDEKESYKMISHLIDRGHKRIAILCVEMDEKSVGYRRLLGYRKALRDHGIAVDERLIREMSGKQEAYTYENGYEVMRELLQEDQNFTAIFVISDIMAMGACRAIIDAGKRVPEDIAVAGFDGIAAGDYFIPRITTIRQPVEEIALTTIKLMFEILEGERKHLQQVFEGELMVKESTVKQSLP